MDGDLLLMAEWREADGLTKLTRLISANSSAWQARGYLHEGLNIRWPQPDRPHHNPGYPGRWSRVDD